MTEYHRLTRTNPPKTPLKPLAIYGATDTLEGEQPDGVVVLEFASRQDAQAWYNSPEYQAALPYRIKAAKHRAFIVDGV